MLLRRASFLLALGAVTDIAFATSVPMKECANCTQAQMLAKAKNNPPGMVFIYDLAHNVIRKFNVFMDSTCANQPVVQSRAGEGQHVQDTGGNGINCGSFKDAEEWTPVDP